MAKQLSVNVMEIFVLKNTKNIRSGELTKKCFLNEMMKIKNVRTHFWRSMKEYSVNKYWKDINLGIWT
nr:hypothetical protein [Mycoplasmopsis bovis]